MEGILVLQAVKHNIKLNKSVKYKLFETRKGRKIAPKMRRTSGIEYLTKFSS